MQEFFGVKIDTSNMTIEELEKTEKEITHLLSSVKFQIQMKKMATHKYRSDVKE